MSLDDSIETIKENMIKHNEADDVRFGVQGLDLTKIKETVYEIRIFSKSTHEKMIEMAGKYEGHETRIRSLEDWKLLTEDRVEGIVDSRKAMSDKWINWKFAVLLAIVAALISSVVGVISASMASKALSAQVQNLTSILKDPNSNVTYGN